MSDLKWISTAEMLPESGEVVDTKLADGDLNNARNEQRLKRSGNLWFLPSGSMYVYYTPTHWRKIEASHE